jgi:APA family basic amino acid/polyamine antiporter
MSRDRLLPPVFARVHPTYKTPFASTWIIGIIAGLISASIPLDKILELTNIGTLFAFCIVSLAVIIMRRTQPELPRKFRCPCVPLVPICAILSCGFLMIHLEKLAWYSFLSWIGIGLIIYFSYSRSNSTLHVTEEESEVEEAA